MIQIITEDKEDFDPETCMGLGAALPVELRCSRGPHPEPLCRSNLDVLAGRTQLKIQIISRAAPDRLAGRIWPAGRTLHTPAIEYWRVPSLQDLFKTVKPEVILGFLKAAALYRLL